MTNEAIKSSIQSLQQGYTVVLVLSLGEAFRQFVADVNNKSQLHWDRLLSLISLVSLIIPFLHGMNRYFFDRYINQSNLRQYGGPLLVDSVAFLIEGGLFFILARSLSADMWTRFYVTVVVLLVFDLIWGILIWEHYKFSIKPWIINDIIFVPLIALTVCLCKSKNRWIGAIICSILVIVRTVCDYAWSWPFYFPDSGA